MCMVYGVWCMVYGVWCECVCGGGGGGEDDWLKTQY